MKNRKRRTIIRVHRFDIKTGIPYSIEEKIHKVVHNVLEREFHCKNYEVAVVLTSDDYIKALNKQYLKRNYTTDVMCFPYSSGCAQKKPLIADIIISVERAKTQAENYNNTFEKELLFLVLHGILHLFGFNDANPAERKKMWSRQKELLKWA